MVQFPGFKSFLDKNVARRELAQQPPPTGRTYDFWPRPRPPRRAACLLTVSARRGRGNIGKREVAGGGPELGSASWLFLMPHPLSASVTASGFASHRRQPCR